MGRGVREAIVALALAAVLLLMLVVVGDRLGPPFSSALQRPQAHAAAVSAQARRLTKTACDAALEWSIDHTAETLFVIIGAVLFLFMRRT
jgi:hypothetical protein